MNQTADNLQRLAAVMRPHKKEFAAVCATAKKLNLPNPKRTPKELGDAELRLQNYVRKIHPLDLKSAIAKHGASAVFSRIASDSILEAAAAKFTEQAVRRAGRK